MDNQIQIEHKEIIEELLKQISHLSEQIAISNIINRKQSEELNKLNNNTPKEDAK